MASGFHIADAYVDVEARFSTNQVRTAVINGLRGARSGIRSAARTTIGRAIIDGIVQAFHAHRLRLEMAITMALRRLINPARAAGRDIGEALITGMIQGLNAARLRAALQATVAAAGRGLSVDVKVKTKRSGMDKFLDSMKKLGSLAGKTLAGALAISAAAGLAQTAALLYAEIAPLIGVIGLIPGVVMAAGLALGVLKLAFFRMGEAIGKGLEGDMKSFNKLLEAMPPAAQDAARQILALGQALKSSVMTSFWSEVTGSIKDLGAIYIPMISNAFNKVATSLGRALSGVVDLMNTQSVVDDWADAFDFAAETIDNLAKGFPKLVAAIASIMAKSSEMMANLTGGFEGLMGRFAAWAERVTSDGSFEAWTQKGLDTFKSLWTALAQIGGLINTVMTGMAAGGGSLISVLGQLAAQADAFFKTLEGAQVLSSFAQVLGEIGGILGGLLVGMGPGLAVFLEALGVGMQALATATAPVAAAFSAILTALAPLLPMLGAELALVLTVLAGLIQAVAPFLQVMATALSTLATAILPLLTDAFNQILAQALPMFVQLATALWQAIEPLLPVIIQIATELIAGLLPAFLEMWKTIGEKLLPILTDLIAQFGDEFLVILQQIIPMLPGLIEAGIALAEAFTELFIAVAPLLPGLIGLSLLFLELVTKTHLVQAILGTLIVVIYLVAAAVGWVTAIIDALKAAFNWCKDAAGQFADKLKSSVTDALNTLGNMVSDVKAKFSGAGDWLLGAGKQIVQGLVNGIKSMIGEVKSALGSITSMIPDWKGPMTVDKKLLRPSGKAIMGGLVRGIGDGKPALKQELNGITASIPRQMGAGTSIGTSYGNVTINATIPAADLAEVKSIEQLLGSLVQGSRARTAASSRKVVMA